MYEYIEGTIAGRGGARLVIDVGGVGYDLSVPVGSAFPHAGRVRAWTHLVVREDEHELVGFATREERDFFRMLLSARGVGPKLALAILSGLPYEELLATIAAGEAEPIRRIRGVGQRTADQVLLDLGKKVRRLLAQRGAVVDGTVFPPERDAHLHDAVQALVSIGFAEKEAQKSVERASEKVGRDDLEALVRAALTS